MTDHIMSTDVGALELGDSDMHCEFNHNTITSSPIRCYPANVTLQDEARASISVDSASMAWHMNLDPSYDMLWMGDLDLEPEEPDFGSEEPDFVPEQPDLQPEEWASLSPSTSHPMNPRFQADQAYKRINNWLKGTSQSERWPENTLAHAISALRDSHHFEYITGEGRQKLNTQCLAGFLSNEQSK
ncbi:hypothetical protein EV702DRAFT_1044806 [Suillus placidus]|uniref:Uncharacterized protein n=1 Tax=Suillus placidus TaxID=48579 RepID=A0A9P6ZXS2_9AGAM|nr:hypothetical protein EV702DRAFT_1044806 [Suillus placidus]